MTASTNMLAPFHASAVSHWGETAANRRCGKFFPRWPQLQTASRNGYSFTHLAVNLQQNAKPATAKTSIVHSMMAGAIV